MRGSPVDVHENPRFLRRRLTSITIVALATLAVAAAVTLSMTTKYTATTRLFFAVEGSEAAADVARGSSLADKQTRSYAEVATSPLVLDPVIDRLDLDRSAADLATAITAVVPADTVILEISVTDSDPQLAATIANAVGTEVTQAAADLSPERADGTKTVAATTLAPALVPTDPSSPKMARNLGLGVVIGLLLGLGVGLVRHVVDTKPATRSAAKPSRAPGPARAPVSSRRPANRRAGTVAPKRAKIEVPATRPPTSRKAAPAPTTRPLSPVNGTEAPIVRRATPIGQ
jgi:polysaccharide biosynthesis transport protein